jgi:O-antigen/teichoic acid export membrane protein
MASIGRGAGWMVVGSLLFLLFGLFGRLGVAKYVSVSAWGVFNLGLSLSGFLSLVALLGLHQATARTLSYERDPWIRRVVVRRSLLITSLDAVAVSTAVYLLSPDLARLFSPGAFPIMTETFRLFSVLIGMTLYSSYLAALFQGFERAQPNAWFNQALGPGLFLVFLVGIIRFHWGYTAVLVAYIGATGVALAGLAGYTLLRLPPVFSRPSTPPPARIGLPEDFWSLTTSLWGVNALSFITTFADTLILGVFWPASTVGLYSAATTLARLFLVANGALTYIYMPVTARLAREKDFATVESTYVTSTRWTVAAAFPLLIVFVLLPSQTLGELFGGIYRGAAVPLIILTITAFVSVAAGPVTSCLAGLGRSRTLLRTGALSAASNLVLSFALIPPLGADGAALAWGVARLVYILGGAFVLYRSFRVYSGQRHLLLPLALAFAATVPAVAVLSLFHPPGWVIFPTAAGALLVYVGCVLGSRSLTPADLLAVRLVERVLGRPLPSIRRILENFLIREPPSPALGPFQGG